jgi:3-oxoacyl-[acyl-carrier-protein] synthase II
MPALVTASAVRTCLGDGPRTYAALLSGACGAAPLRHPGGDRLNVTHGYHAAGAGPFGAARLLSACVADAAARSGLDTGRRRVTALVGSGLRELGAVEDYALTGVRPPRSRLHFADAVRRVLPGVTDVITVSNACSAGGHVLALAEDMLAQGDADAVVVAAADTMTRSMLAMIGRVSEPPTTRVRPFDADRTGVLLGDGAAALVVEPADASGPALARVAGTGLSCDARHETAPDVDGICRAMRDAYARAGRTPAETDLVVAHGTGTALNDPAECRALHSGAAALVNVDVAIRCLSTGLVPPVVGLRTVLPEGTGLRFAVGDVAGLRPRLVQVDAFGFGGVNAVSLLEAP